jgi:hypothetical protein
MLGLGKGEREKEKERGNGQGNGESASVPVRRSPLFNLASLTSCLAFIALALLQC